MLYTSNQIFFCRDILKDGSEQGRQTPVGLLRPLRGAILTVVFAHFRRVA